MIDMSEKPGDRRGFVHKKLFGAAKGFLSGGPTGAIGGFLSAGRRTQRPRAQARRIRRRAPQRVSRRSIQRRVIPVPGIGGFLQRRIPGGRTGLMVAGAAQGGGCPQGFHPNKSDYMTKAGFVAEGTKCVRNRRRNLSNGRANTRSLRRIVAWDKQDRKLGKSLKSIARGR